MGPSVSNYVSHRPFADLTDMTLADEDTNSILTDNEPGVSGNDFWTFGNISIPEFWERDSDVVIPGNDREREYGIAKLSENFS